MNPIIVWAGLGVGIGLLLKNLLENEGNEDVKNDDQTRGNRGGGGLAGKQSKPDRKSNRAGVKPGQKGKQTNGTTDETEPDDAGGITGNDSGGQPDTGLEADNNGLEAEPDPDPDSEPVTDPDGENEDVN